MYLAPSSTALTSAKPFSASTKRAASLSGTRVGSSNSASASFAEAGFQGDLALGAALLLIRQVEVFETGLGVGELDVAGQFGGQLALFLDAGEDRAAAFFQFAQVAQALFQHAQLGIVEAAGDLFAVTGDEGNGGAFVEQGDGSGDLLRLNAAGGQCGELFGDTGVDAVH